MYHNDVQQIEHEAMPITKYFETRRVKDRQTMQKKQRCPNTFVRCKVHMYIHQMPTTAALSTQMRIMVTSLDCVVPNLKGVHPYSPKVKRSNDVHN